MDADYTRVGSVDDFTVGRATSVLLDGRRVAVFRLTGGFHAIQEACPHQGASLVTEGRLLGEHVTCTRHNRRFHLVSGESNMRSGARVKVYDVQVENGDVYLRPPHPETRDQDSEGDDDWVDATRFFKKKD